MSSIDRSRRPASITVLFVTAMIAASAPADRVPQQLVEEATVLIPPGRCAGAVVSDQRHVLTAAHCLRGREDIDIELHDGRRVRASVERLDKEKDFALLKLSDDAEVTPLRFASELPDPGDALYFGGRADRHGSNQIFAVVRIGRCPSLPQVDNAIFTNLRARKGDSGAPLVNRNLEVVGLVHGGERCNIAAPTIGLDAELGLDSGAEPSACVWGHC